MNNKSIIIGGVIVVVIGVIFLYAKGSKMNQTKDVVDQTMKQDVIPTQNVQEINKENKDIKTIEVEAGSFYYKPKEIKVKKGQTVKIVLKSVSMMHDFNIDELGVKVPITKKGSTASAEFTASKTGTFEYYCSVGQHRKNGQVGKIIVEE